MSIPKLTHGKYKGLSIDKVPMSYLRWMLGQNFPKEYIEFAEKKVAKNKTSNIYIEVSRHATDNFSLRHLSLWENREDKEKGIASFVSEMAYTALSQGKDISKNRRSDDERILLFNGVKFVFSRNNIAPTLITVM